MKRRLKDCFIVLVLLVDDAAILAAVLLVLWLLKIEITLWLIAALILPIGVLALVIHRKVIPNLRKKPVTGRERMVGLSGRVIEPLKPVGTIRVEGEYWQARCIDVFIESGEDVEIIEMRELVLRVRPKKCAPEAAHGGEGSGK